MERLRKQIKWSQWPEAGKTVFFLVLIFGVTLGGYGIFRIVMGTPSPLVVVTSESMSPTLHRGYLLVLQKQAPEDINIGEIVVYNATWHSSAPVVHRVIARENISGVFWYTVKGDSNIDPDPPFPYDRIIGVVIASVPWIGNITLFLQQPGVLPVIIVILIIIMIIPEFLPKKDDDKDKMTTPDENIKSADNG